MNKETLNKAKELNRKIKNVEFTITNLTNYDIAICGFDNGEYFEILELTDDELNRFISKQKIKLAKLEKELKEL